MRNTIILPISRFFSVLRERKSTIKRTIRYGQYEPALYPLVEDSPDIFMIPFADTAFLYGIHAARMRYSNQPQQRDNKPKITSSKSVTDWDTIKRSVKNALRVQEQKFNDKV